MYFTTYNELKVFGVQPQEPVPHTHTLACLSVAEINKDQAFKADLRHFMI